MSKLNNLNPKQFLAPFKKTLGFTFDKVCADIASDLGRLEKDIQTKSGDWKPGTKGKLLSKDGHTLQLPLNAPWCPLVMFGLQLTAIAKNGSSLEPAYTMGVEADIPAICVNWVDTKYRNISKPVEA